MSDTFDHNVVLDHIESFAKDVLIGTKDQISPLFDLVTETGERILAPAVFTSDKAKASFYDVLRHLIQEKNVVAYAHVTEAWTLEFKNEPSIHLSSIGPISKHPDRIEIVLGVAATRAMIKVAMWRIVRGEDGSCIDLKRDNDIDNGVMGGAVVDLFGSEGRTLQ